VENRPAGALFVKVVRPEKIHEKLRLTDFSIDHISDAIQWITPDARFWNVNRAACAMLGYSREELLTLSIGDIDPDFTLEAWRDHWELIKRSGSLRMNRRHRTKDGRLFPVEITSNIIISNDTEYYCAIVRDVSDRKKAEQEASFFKTLIEYTRDPFYVLSPEDDCRMVYANRAACEHYGMDLERLRTLRIPDWDPAFDMNYVEPLMQEQRKGAAVRFETVHRVASGKEIPVEVTSSLLVHEGREYLCGYFYDISARKAMEDTLKESETRYRSLYLEFQALLDGIPDGLTLLSPDLNVLWANPAAAHPTGHESSDLIGSRCYHSRHGYDQPCEGCIVRETFADGESRQTVIEQQTTGRTFELRSVPVKDDAGKVVKVIEISRDITARIKAEAERVELERKLLHARKLESLGILAGGIAHDFNNILTGIMGNLSLLRMLLPDEHKAIERIERCEQAVSQATGLTCQLLTFAKGGDPVKKSIDLRPIIENAVGFALAGSSATSRVTIATDLWTVEADEGQIVQVINNLLINASQAMPKGGEICLEASNCSLNMKESPSLKKGYYVKIRVSDQGQGIAPEHMAKIFDPYFTTKQTGTGLGLTSAYSIVRKHGGDILVSSRVGEGTRFELYLPASHAPAEPASLPATPTPTAGKGSIMIMDDEEYIRDLLTAMLSRLGYEVEGCSRGEELIRRYRESAQDDHSPDAVILDLTIRGGMGGLDAAKAILEFDSAARLMVASGYSNDPVMANYRKYGFVAALPKPYRLEDVSAGLSKVLSLKAPF
jgi:PAS domain S-box-containing protein